MSEANLDDLKRAFAGLLVKQRPGDTPFKIALDIGLETSYALRVCNEWLNDPVVIEEQKRIVESVESEEDLLPSKKEAAQLAWNWANGELMFEDRLKALELYGKLRGWVGNKDAKIVNNNNVAPRVMVLRDHGSDADWEAKLRAQQAGLTQEASPSANVATG